MESKRWVALLNSYPNLWIPSMTYGSGIQNAGSMVHLLSWSWRTAIHLACIIDARHINLSVCSSFCHLARDIRTTYPIVLQSCPTNNLYHNICSPYQWTALRNRGDFIKSQRFRGRKGVFDKALIVVLVMRRDNLFCYRKTPFKLYTSSVYYNNSCSVSNLCIFFILFIYECLFV